MTRVVKRTINIMLVCQFLICLGMSLIFPVEPAIKQAYHLSAFDMGVMAALFALVQFVASPVVGRVSDKWGRKQMLVWGLGIFAGAEFLFAACNSLAAFNTSRAIDGLAAAMFVPTSMALAADITTPAQRAKVIGWLSASFSGGLILGPGIGGILAADNFKLPFWVAGVLGVISTIVAAIWLPSDEKVGVTHHEEHRQEKSTMTALKEIWSPTVSLLFLMILVAAFGLAGFEAIYSLYVNQVHGFDLGQIALVLTLNGIISLVLQVFCFEAMVKWLGELRLVRWAYLLAAVGTVFVIYDGIAWQITLATLVVFGAFDLLRPAITTLLTDLGEDNQGLINGMNMSLTSVGNVIGPLMAGALLDRNYLYPYWVVIAFLLVAWVLTFAVRRRFRA